MLAADRRPASPARHGRRASPGTRARCPARLTLIARLMRARAHTQWFRNRRMFFNFAGSCTRSLPPKITPAVARAKFDSWMLFRKK